MGNESLITLSEFLISIPPGKKKFAELLTTETYNSRCSLEITDIELYCDNKRCSGMRYFSCMDRPTVGFDEEEHLFITFQCKNCNDNYKFYSLYFRLIETNKCEVFKIGELPQFGPPMPNKMFKLIGQDKDLFLIGRRAENQGMGIGAFAYYRRVVENQKDRIFDEVIKVLENVKDSEELIDEIKKAKNETQFTKAIESIKSVLPDVLMIAGHNPLTLLHKALSEGLHSESDENCLEMATNIRVILFELSDRISHVLKEQNELNKAISSLFKKGN